MAKRPKPETIRMDNGPELTGRHFLTWSVERQIELVHIQSAKPTQNAMAESFQGRLRDEFLNVSWFWNLWDARQKVTAWREEYNCERPHSSLDYRKPEEFAALVSTKQAAELCEAGSLMPGSRCMDEAGQEASIASPVPRTRIPVSNELG